MYPPAKTQALNLTSTPTPINLHSLRRAAPRTPHPLLPLHRHGAACCLFREPAGRRLLVPSRANASAPPLCLPVSFPGSGRPPSVTTASKKRKVEGHAPLSPHEGARLESPRSSPLPAPASIRNSASPPRFLPPHLHDEVLDATHDLAADSYTAASSPSEAYANMTLNGEQDSSSRPAEHRPRPRASSPAKRLHSDMEGGHNMDLDGPAPARRGSGQGSPLAAKPPATASTRSLRATSVDMADATPNGPSTVSSESMSASNAESAATSVSATSAVHVPALDEQVDRVLALSRKPLQEHQVGYIVSQKWLERVWARTPQYADKQREFSKSAGDGEIGPVDNSDLVDTATLSPDLVDQQGDVFIPLRPGLTLEYEYEVLPVEAWELVISWYGVKEGTPVIRRYVHNTSPDKFSQNLQYEVYPPIFTIRKVRKTSPATDEPSKKLVASRADSFVNFIKAAKQAAGIDAKHNVRIWRILNSNTASDQAPQQPSGMLTPEASPPPPARLPLIMDAASLTGLDVGTEREEVTGKDEQANEAFNDELNIAAAGLAEDQVLVLEEQGDKGEYLTDTLSKPSVKSVLSNKAGKRKSSPNSGRSTPVSSGPMTRGRTRTGKTRGTTGLTNLGNSCYMNSALQCIRSVEELAIYFLAGDYKRDINPDNPLGHGGQIAKSYAGLLTSIYDETGLSSFAPKNFKNTLGRAAPIFSGYGQQDSQEFLSFLVDGLHEDLNRIKKKPYTEYPESDDKTVHDPEAIKALGNKFRAIHHSRNDSVAMDLFNGFYKNTMVCPDCNKVSITFDPYSLVTLQLPIEQTWQHPMKFVPLFGEICELEIDIDKNATVKNLKEYVGKRFGVEWNRLMASEVYSNKFYRHLYDSETLADCNITQRDEIYIYEIEDVPTNWPGPKKKHQYEQSSIWRNNSEEDLPKADHAHHERVLVPIFHRKGRNLTLWPSYILVNREEARDYDAILKKVLAKVAQMTTRDILSEGNTTSAPESGSGSEVVLTTEEDSLSDGDPLVQDRSVEGEDIVEVTMTEPLDITYALPEVLRPESFLPPGFRNLFEMKYSRPGKDYVPTGWSSLETHKSFEPILKRVRVPSTRASSTQSLDAESNVTSSDEDDNPQFSADAQSSIEAANQSSDEDMQPSIEETPSFSRGGRQKKHMSKKARRQERKHMNNKTFKARKGKDRHIEQPSQSYDELDDEDDDRLIKLGEAVVLEWNADAYDALFGGVNADDSRGMDTTKFVKTHEDEELQAKKVKRAARRKNGLQLEECFAETSKCEVLSEDNAWYCNRCKELRRATKTLEIWTAPDILVVHLKRFSSHRIFRDKVDALVDFPIEGLDLSERVGLSEGKELVYDLFAVDNHYGGLGGGHYTAYAKNFFDQQWYEYNDSSVMKVSNPNSVVTTAAYLLFYRRRSAGPLGPPELQQIVHAWRNPDSEAADNSDDAKSRTASPSGNGLRLGGSSRNSRNGSSSAFAAGAGALYGGGSGAAGSLLQNGVAAGNRELDDTPPDYNEDEGYDDGHSVDMSNHYAPLGLHHHLDHDHEPVWNFANLSRDPEQDADGSDVAGLGEGDDLQDRMQEDFGDDEIFASGMGMGMPVEDVDVDEGVEQVLPALLPDDELAEIHIKQD